MKTARVAFLACLAGVVFVAGACDADGLPPLAPVFPAVCDSSQFPVIVTLPSGRVDTLTATVRGCWWNRTARGARPGRLP